MVFAYLAVVANDRKLIKLVITINAINVSGRLLSIIQNLDYSSFKQGSLESLWGFL